MKKFGIRITLPEDSPLRAPHLLGDNWEGFRWFATSTERDAAFNEMRQQPDVYRQGDVIQQILNKVERQ